MRSDLQKKKSKKNIPSSNRIPRLTLGWEQTLNGDDGLNVNGDS